jgi:choloylglycine hydrolase
MEFPIDFKSAIIAIPRNTEFVGTLPDKKAGLRWKNKYGILGANGFGIDHILDGMNEKGLAVGLYYFSRHAEYQPLTSKTAKRSLAPWELGTYLLSTCATIQDVRTALARVYVVPTYQETMKNIPPLHYTVHDALGKSLVIEYIKGELTLYDNPLGVMTNSPSFDWQLTNLRNYVHLFTPQPIKISLHGVELFPTGQGSNFWGLPGDFTPPSRFVRLVTLSQTAHPEKTAADGVNLAINIINNITIPRGSVVEEKGDAKQFEYTQWTTVCDLTNMRLYYRTYDNHCYRYVDAKKLSFTGKTITRIIMDEPACYADYTNKLQ